jgi:hypothetical protein
MDGMPAFLPMAGKYFQTEKQEREQQEAVRAEYGCQLRARYGTLITEHLPEQLAALIGRLADKLE